MNQLDVCILIGLFGAALWGWGTGLTTQIGLGVGTIGGMFLGAALAPRSAALVTSATAKLSVTTLTIVAAVVACATIGSRLGRRAAHYLHRRKLGTVERGLGVVVAATTTLFVVWLVAVSLSSSTNPVGELIQRSSIIGRLDDLLPPVPTITAGVSSLLNPAGFPRVFAGLEPRFSAPVPDPPTGDVDAITKQARASTVKIEGAGCGGLLDGSGFVAAPDLVVTNAHVVAGVRSPNVLDAAGRHQSVVVLFNPSLDIAVLRLSGLAGEPLTLAATDAERGRTGAILGYPGGGPFTTGPGAVRTTLPAIGRDIYDQRLVTRTIYELQGKIRPGNSGGPFVLDNGDVAGVVFARSISDSTIGYAVAASEVRPLVEQASRQSTGVSTGPCT